jgi:glycerate-2-kinase
MKRGVAETPKPRDPLFGRVDNILIGDNQAAVDAVVASAKQQGLGTLVLSTTLTGEARELAKMFGAMAREIAAQGRPIQPTSVAGAVVDGDTVARAHRGKLSLSRALLDNDAYPVFEKLRGHIVTGPTGTNVNDLYLLLAL